MPTPAPDLNRVVYKICPRAAWDEACRAGHYSGSADDLRDGYIHLSAQHQVAATAAKYFRGQDGLVLVSIATAPLGAALVWEPSRGGDLFPHLYGPLPASAAVAVTPVPLDGNGVPVLPEICS